ncbi:MAG: cytidine deaminase [Candidatus Woesebacteria bacterium]|nr:cytidine deaminase [Candidatus Woesebacteria bacterium]
MRERLQDHIRTPSAKELVGEVKFIKSAINEIGEERILHLVDVAIKYRGNAYTPYSSYNVGASLLTTNGQVFGGCNSESCGYSPTNHAEGTAIAKAVSEGSAKKDRKFIKAVAVCAEGDSGPCGECLQRIVEHTDNCLIVNVDPKGKIGSITSLKTSLPYNFNPSHLGK